MADPVDVVDREAPEGDHTAEVARGGALVAVGSAVSMVLNFGIILIVTHTYGADGAGVFFSAIALFTLAGTTAKLGSETGLVYSISRAMALRREDDVMPTLRMAVLAPLVLGLLLGSAAMATSDLLAEVFSDPADAEDYALVVRNVALLLPAFVAVQVLAGATRGLGEMKPTVLGGAVGRPALQIVPIAIVAAGGLGLGSLGLAWAMPLAVTAIGMYVWLNHLLDEQGVPRIVLHPRPGLSREFWSYAAPRGFANTLQTAQDKVGILVVGAVATAGTTGVFVTVARLIGAMQLFTHAVGQALNPQISALIARDDRAGAQRLLQQVSAWTAVPMVPIAVTLLAFPEAILGLFGAEFERGASALAILAGVTLVTAILGHADNVLLMGGRSGTSLLDVAASLAVTLTALLVLVPDHGLVGAAIGWSLGMVTYSLLPLWQGWRLLGLHPFGRESGYLALATLASLALAGAGRLALGTSPTASGLGCLAAGLAYLAVLYRYRDEIGLAELVELFRDRARG